MQFLWYMLIIVSPLCAMSEHELWLHHTQESQGRVTERQRDHFYELNKVIAFLECSYPSVACEKCSQFGFFEKGNEGKSKIMSLSPTYAIDRDIAIIEYAFAELRLGSAAEDLGRILEYLNILVERKKYLQKIGVGK